MYNIYILYIYIYIYIYICILRSGYLGSYTAERKTERAHLQASVVIKCRSFTGADKKRCIGVHTVKGQGGVFIGGVVIFRKVMGLDLCSCVLRGAGYSPSPYAPCTVVLDVLCASLSHWTEKQNF